MKTINLPAGFTATPYGQGYAITGPGVATMISAFPDSFSPVNKLLYLMINDLEPAGKADAGALKIVGYEHRMICGSPRRCPIIRRVASQDFERQQERFKPAAGPKIPPMRPKVDQLAASVNRAATGNIVPLDLAALTAEQLVRTAPLVAMLETQAGKELITAMANMIEQLVAKGGEA